MRLWSVSDKEINQLYNNRNIVIPAGSVKDYNDDLAVFLLSKRPVRGQGLVQLKDNDSKKDRYAEGRLHIFEWATEKYSDFEHHCEERESQRLQPLRPHAEIVEYKRLIDDYNKWVEEGCQFDEGSVSDGIERKITFACPYCEKDDFVSKEALKGHLMSHQKKEKVDVDTSTTGNKSSPKGR